MPRSSPQSKEYESESGRGLPSFARRVFRLSLLAALIAISFYDQVSLSTWFAVQQEQPSNYHSGKAITDAIQSSHNRPLCPIDDPNVHDDGMWVRDDSITELPYYSEKLHTERFPRCMEIEAKYNTTGEIPEFLKYHWQPHSCDIAQLDRHIFCKLLDGKSIGILGDSISGHFAHSLIGLMRGRFTGFYGESYANLVVQLCDAPYSVKLNFRRWDYWKSDVFEHTRLAELAFYSDILVLNFGAHYQPWLEMKTHTKDLIQILERHWKPPQKRPEWLFWRSTIVAHEGCDKATAPVNLTSTEFGYNRAPKFHTIDIMQQQRELVWPLLKASSILNVTFLKVENSMYQRPDGHRVVRGDGVSDCLHYCEPGPTDSWIHLFYHHIVMMAEAS